MRLCQSQNRARLELLHATPLHIVGSGGESSRHQKETAPGQNPRAAVRVRRTLFPPASHDITVCER